MLWLIETLSSICENTKESKSLSSAPPPFRDQIQILHEMGVRLWHLMRSEWFVVSDKSVRYWHRVHLLFHTAHSLQEHVYTNQPWFQFESMLLTHHSTHYLRWYVHYHVMQIAGQVSRNRIFNIYIPPCLLLPFVKLLDFGVEGDRVQYRISDYRRCSRLYSVIDMQSNFKCCDDMGVKLHMIVLGRYIWHSLHPISLRPLT
jgi:hypothetical protein